MSRTVTSAIVDLRSSITVLTDAWAAWRESALNAHIAAVMGSQLYRQLRFDDYSAADWIVEDSRLTQEISCAKKAAPQLQAAVENNLEHIMKWCREAVMVELIHLDPSFNPNSSRLESLLDTLDKANDEHKRLTNEIERKLGRFGSP